MPRLLPHVLSFLVVSTWLSPVAAAPTPAQRCEADVELASARFTQCRLTAESKYSKAGDAAKRSAALTKCSRRLSDAFAKANTRYGSSSCTNVAAGEFDSFLSQCTDDVVAASIAGGSLPDCGNGAVDVAGEQCDGGDFGGETCASLGLGAGALSCDGTCRFDTSACRAITCGNGVFELGEQCEVDWASGVVVSGGGDCISQGFDAGTLGCSTGCSYDTSRCRHQTCGDGFADTPEQCDGSDLDGQTCAGLGYFGGTLACDNSCAVDTSACTACGAIMQEDWQDGDDAGWNGWQGVQVIGSGVLSLTRSAVAWGATSQDFPSPVSGALRLSATLSLVEPSSRVNVCIVDTGAFGLVTYIEPNGSLVRHNGYCVILTDESAWGSPTGVHLVANQNVANDTDLLPLIATSFLPSAGQPYRVALSRDPSGTWELFVNDISAGTAVDTTTTSWNAITLNAGADGNVGGGGIYDDIVVENCSLR